MDPNGSLQVPSGSFRFLQIIPEFLAAFRLKDFQSCLNLHYFEAILDIFVIFQHIDPLDWDRTQYDLTKAK